MSINFPHPHCGYQSWQYAGDRIVSPLVPNLVANLNEQADGIWHHQIVGYQEHVKEGCWPLHDFLIPPLGNNEAKLWLYWTTNGIEGHGNPRLYVSGYFPYLHEHPYKDFCMRAFVPQPQLSHVELEFRLDAPMSDIVQAIASLAPRYLDIRSKAEVAYHKAVVKWQQEQIKIEAKFGFPNSQMRQTEQKPSTSAPI